MADSEALIVPEGWGGLTLATGRIAEIELRLDNGVGACAQADFAARRLSYLETLHDLTHAPVTIYECYAGIATEAAFDAELATRESAPARVLYFARPDLVNGGTNTYWWSDQVLAGVDALRLEPLFTGHIDGWSYTLNDFRLMLTGTERAEEKEIPERKVTLAGWPYSRFEDEGKAYPEIWGSHGAALDADKIGAGIGAVPAILVNRASLKYVVAGHALTTIGGAASGTCAVWCKIAGIENFLGYIEGAALDIDDTDGEGNACATVTLPEFPLAYAFIPTLVEGGYFTHTAGAIPAGWGRGTGLAGLVENGEIFCAAIGETVAAGAKVFRVWIKCSQSTANLRARWAGPQAQVVSSPGNTAHLDSAAGFSAAGLLQLSTGVFEYTGITEVSATEYTFALTADPGAPSGDATEVGAWQTLGSGSVEVTEQRNWDETNFQYLEIEIENTHASTDYSITFAGFRVQVEPGTYPEIFVDCTGVNVTVGGADKGASRNPVWIVEDFHTRVLGLAEARIGSTFAAAAGLLTGWNLEVALFRAGGSAEALEALLKQCKAFLWRDGENDIQIGIYRLDDASTVTIDSETDIVDPDGTAFEVGYTDPEEIFNRVTLNWAPARFREGYSEQYLITEESATPVDTARVQAAADSQAANLVKNTLTLNAEFVQDAATALELLQFLFEFYSVRRRRLRFPVVRHLDLRPGTVALVTHPLVASAAENYLIERVTLDGLEKRIEAIALALEAQSEDGIAFVAAASAQALA